MFIKWQKKDPRRRLDGRRQNFKGKTRIKLSLGLVAVSGISSVGLKKGGAKKS